MGWSGLVPPCIAGDYREEYCSVIMTTVLYQIAMGWSGLVPALWVLRRSSTQEEWRRAQSTHSTGTYILYCNIIKFRVLAYF